METKANYVLIGASTVVGVVLLMLFAMWMANSEFSRGYNEYDIVFSDPVRGLSEGGEVRFNGIKVGEVKSLRFDPDNSNRVIARVRITADAPLRQGSDATLEAIGLTGVTLIQLSAGPPNAPLLRQDFGGPVPRLAGHGSQIDVIVARSQDVVIRASEAMAAVRDLLTDENIAHISDVIRNLDTVSKQLASEQSVISRSAETAQSVTNAANHVTALVTQTQHDMADLGEIMHNLKSASASISGDTLPEVSLAVEDIRRAAASINRVANNLDDNPSVLTPQAPRPTVELPQ